jgi:hypothetical protein
MHGGTKAREVVTKGFGHELTSEASRIYLAKVSGAAVKTLFPPKSLPSRSLDRVRLLPAQAEPGRWPCRRQEALEQLGLW